MIALRHVIALDVGNFARLPKKDAHSRGSLLYRVWNSPSPATSETAQVIDGAMSNTR